jgi:hypothetical protein
LETAPVISRDIADNEYFVRVIKYPVHFDVNANKMKRSAVFMPKWRFIDGVYIMDGVSLDRLAYCTIPESKARAISGIGSGDNSYKGMATISLPQILSINSMTIAELAIPGVNTEIKFIKRYISNIDGISGMLKDFNLPSAYCGIVATPMDEKQLRIPIPTPVRVDELGNPAHAELFYMFRLPPAPDQPQDTFVQEMARILKEYSTIELD